MVVESVAAQIEIEYEQILMRNRGSDLVRLDTEEVVSVRHTCQPFPMVDSLTTHVFFPISSSHLWVVHIIDVRIIRIQEVTEDVCIRGPVDLLSHCSLVHRLCELYIFCEFPNYIALILHVLTVGIDYHHHVLEPIFGAGHLHQDCMEPFPDEGVCGLRLVSIAEHVVESPEVGGEVDGLIGTALLLKRCFGGVAVVEEVGVVGVWPLELDINGKHFDETVA